MTFLVTLVVIFCGFKMLISIRKELLMYNL
jgi:hypothetical protein